MTERPVNTLKAPHTVPLPRKADSATFADIPGFHGITERDGKWTIDLAGPPSLSVAKEIVRRIKTT